MSKLARAERYTTVAIWLHWLIAALVLFNLFSGFFASLLGGMEFHFSAGISILFLTALRIVWRLIHEPPALAPHMQPWARVAARMTHFLLYVLMVAMPLTGWAIVSSHPPAWSAGERWLQSQPDVELHGPPVIWGLWTLPRLGPIQRIGSEAGSIKAQDRLHDELEHWHSIGGYCFLALLMLHMAGALKHQFIDRDNILARMGVARAPITEQPAQADGIHA